MVRTIALTIVACVVCWNRARRVSALRWGLMVPYEAERDLLAGIGAL